MCILYGKQRHIDNKETAEITLNPIPELGCSAMADDGTLCKSNRIHLGLMFMFIFIFVSRYSGGARHSCISMGSSVDASALLHRASRKHRCNHSDGVHCLSIVECIWDKRPLKMIFEWLALRSAEFSSRECTPWKIRSRFLS